MNDPEPLQQPSLARRLSSAIPLFAVFVGLYLLPQLFRHMGLSPNEVVAGLSGTVNVVLAVALSLGLLMMIYGTFTRNKAMVVNALIGTGILAFAFVSREAFLAALT